MQKAMLMETHQNGGDGMRKKKRGRVGTESKREQNRL